MNLMLLEKTGSGLCACRQNGEMYVHIKYDWDAFYHRDYPLDSKVEYPDCGIMHGNT